MTIRNPLALGALLAAATLAAVPVGSAFAGFTQKPTVVELYTSQSCFSCPPAIEYLGELAKQPDIIALEFHVDYWNDLVYGRAGKWKDRFSSAEHTKRQAAYNLNLRGKRQVYTPQMVIDGRSETVGSHRRSVSGAIKFWVKSRPAGLNVVVSNRAAGGISIRVDGTSSTTVGIWLVRFDKRHTTRVRAGENKGKTLTNRNVVREMRRVGDWRGTAMTVEVPDLRLGANQGCAILAQSDSQGPILGAAACPA